MDLTATWDPAAAAGVVETLRARLVDQFRSIVTPGVRVALLDFPEYGNVGDSAIWLGELAAVRASGGGVAYAAGQSTYDPGALRLRLGRDGIVLLSGGGNLGDLWPKHQRFRERVLADLPEFRVVQLPQSVHFEDAANREQARRAFQAHPRFTLWVRDEASVAAAGAELGVSAALVPDAAFAMGRLSRPAASQPLQWLSRDDKETPPGRGAAGPVPPVDWIDDRGRVLDAVGSLLRLRGGAAPNRLWRTWARARAARRLDRGCRLLARGRVLVSNRLHGHILALQMGIPHFVSDTAQGKLGAFYRTWIQPFLPGIWCGSEQEALERAVQFAGTRETLVSQPR